MNNSKPKVFGPVRAVCPVCGKTAYSLGGIHPQCSVKREDNVARQAKAAALALEPELPH